MLEIIERQDRRLARFVDELLDLGKIQINKIYFDFEEVDLEFVVVRDAVSGLGAELTATALSYREPSLRPMGQFD